MKYFMNIELLYEKLFVISKYCSISNSNVNTVITDMNNIELYWNEGFSNWNSFSSLYYISKELNIPPLSVKCAIAQVKCFKKWKNSKYNSSYLLRDISRYGRHA